MSEYLRLLLLFEHENDVVCIFQIDKVFFTGYLNTRVLETLQRSSHYFIDHKVKKEWREWASLTDAHHDEVYGWKKWAHLTDTILRAEALEEISAYYQAPESMTIHKT
ncbi:hypothetical protein T265_07271 [Opisthorchis viverrini]|uniref:Uncharacterized protein n=1 Tax=Opisthorchis viverrini TaxID=6198 RepID=A0A074ZD77_OPIVI|nr:hypothetical protein T265_07271 [Opisthorchis viverrini]KER25231.1 hypothetical protein T265_07271 [Opisthorchis viverrini]